MVSGLFLGSVLRGADEDQQAADEDVCVPAGQSSFVFTLIRACAEHSHIKQEEKSLSCTAKKGSPLNMVLCYCSLSTISFDYHGGVVVSSIQKENHCREREKKKNATA